ncbi:MULTISPECIES: hypothetical protein [unclassified Cohnella]|uniref:hypothetical protein n=1 Tax=unclassified Cohnella TaxID=2636738 RepID=UPI00117D1089|nr:MULTISPECIES: hypothetical protein [unclassified Cohnella]
MNDRFETEYSAWLAKHVGESRGERLRRLRTRHGFGEKLLLQQAWWQVVENLDFLYPEYEIVAPDGKYYYLDLPIFVLPSQHASKPTASDLMLATPTAISSHEDWIGRTKSSLPIGTFCVFPSIS